jgi:DNA-binding MarR family transcriptional regulator
MTEPLPASTARASRRSGIDAERLASWRAFIRAHAHVMRHLSQELLDEESLPATWYDVLVQLSEADGRRLRMQDLADRVLLSQSGLTRLVDRMEKSGLVERVRCPEDGRGLFTQLTPDGLETLRRAYPTHLRGVREWFADLLTDEEAIVLGTALARIADNARPPAGSAGADRAGGG